MTHGFQIQGAYTWAHAIDDSPDPIDPAQGARTFPRNSRDLVKNAAIPITTYVTSE